MSKAISFDPFKWSFVTALLVAIVEFIALWIGAFSNWSNLILDIVLWLTTSLCGAMIQFAMVREAFPSQSGYWIPILLISLTIGWMISWFLLSRLTNTSINSDDLLAAAMQGGSIGAVIGLPPGLSSSLAYWLLLRSRFSTGSLMLSNVLGWCLGMSIGFAAFMTLLAYALSNFNVVF